MNKSRIKKVIEDLMPNQEMSSDQKGKMRILDGEINNTLFYKQRFFQLSLMLLNFSLNWASNVAWCCLTPQAH